MIFDDFETAGLTRDGWIKENKPCPFSSMCKTIERCPTIERTYDHKFSCAMARGLAVAYRDEIKKERDKYEKRNQV